MLHNKCSTESFEKVVEGGCKQRVMVLKMPLTRHYSLGGLRASGVVFDDAE